MQEVMCNLVTASEQEQKFHKSTARYVLDMGFMWQSFGSGGDT